MLTRARLYVDFKNQVKEESNSLRDILTYTKYDKEKLHFVFSRVGLGINLSKAKEDLKAQISKDVSRYMPYEEIAESDAFNDYSYITYSLVRLKKKTGMKVAISFISQNGFSTMNHSIDRL